MKKKSNKKVKVPAHMFGMFAQIGQAVEGMGQGLIDSGMGDLGQTLAGAANPAKAGLQYLGNDDVSVGNKLLAFTGVGSMFARRQAEKARKKREESAKTAQQAMNTTAAMNQDYWQDNDLAMTFSDGGILPDLAYLDNNEVVRSTDGNIEQVPNNKPGTDNHLVDASNLESVLSDKLKRPGTNKTFAQEGKHLTNMTKPSKGKDRFAENTDRLNKANANRKYNQLLIEQEELKDKKGIKPKSKGIPAYQDGTRKIRFGIWNPTEIELNGANVNNFLNREMDTNFSDAVDTDSYIGITGRTRLKKSPSAISGSAMGLVSPTTGAWFISPKGTPASNNKFVPVDTPEVSVNEETVELSPINTNSTVKGSAKSATKSTTPSTKSTTAPVTKSAAINTPSKLQADLYPDLYGGELYKAPKDMPTGPKQFSPNIAKRLSKREQLSALASEGDGNGLSALESLAGLAPTLYNMFEGMGKPEVESTVLNPYSGAAMRSMARRRLNIEPTLEANRRSRAIANYNMANLNANTGMNLAGRTQMAAAEYAQNADLYANRDNANNAYLADYANTLNSLGQQFVQSQTLTNDLNARNRAARRNYNAAAFSQMGKWAQVQQQMNNQAGRDNMMYPLLENFLSQGYTADQIKRIQKANRNYGR